MRCTTFFVVSPKQDLVDSIRRVGSQELADLAMPVLWDREVGDPDFLDRVEAATLVKLLFVDALIRERSSAAGFADVFGLLNVTVADFDMRWSVGQVPLDFSVEYAISDALMTGTLDALIAQAGPELGKKLDIYRERACRTRGDNKNAPAR
jgi:hypothetical protein